MLLQCALMVVCAAEAPPSQADSSLQKHPEYDAAMEQMDRAFLEKNLSTRDLRRYQVAYRKACQFRPRTFAPHWHWALIQINHRHCSTANQVLATCLRIKRRHPYVLRAQSYCCARRGKFEKALALLAAAAKRDPGSKELGRNAGRLMGIVARRSGRRAVAARAATLQGELKPEAFQALAEGKQEYAKVVETKIRPIYEQFGKSIEAGVAKRRIHERAIRSLLTPFDGKGRSRRARVERRRGGTKKIRKELTTHKREVANCSRQIRGFESERNAQIERIDRAVCTFDLQAAWKTK